MTAITSVLSLIFLSAGCFFFVVGSIGLNRMPDVYTRLHTTTKCDTLGQTLTLLGMAIYEGMTFTTVKILIIIAFVLIANPTGAHALAKGAYLSGVKPCEITKIDAYGERIGGERT